MSRKMRRWVPGMLLVFSFFLGIYQSIVIAACQVGDCVEISAWGNQVNGANSCLAYYLDNKCTMPTQSCLMCGSILCSNQNTKKCCEDIEIFNANCMGANCSLGCPAPVLATSEQEATCTNPQVNTAQAGLRYKCVQPTSDGSCP